MIVIVAPCGGRVLPKREIHHAAAQSPAQGFSNDEGLLIPTQSPFQMIISVFL